MSVLIYGIIIGIILWQILIFIFYLISHKDIRKSLRFAECILILLGWILYWIREGIKKFIDWVDFKINGYYY